jgi:hypothetical protein
LTLSAYELAKETLFTAVRALGAHRKSVILVGAQAIYVHTADVPLKLEPFTNDADLVLQPGLLEEHPALDKLLREAGFLPAPNIHAVGSWVSPEGVQLDLMVPSSFGGSGRRSARLPNHGDATVRKTSGLHAALHDNMPFQVSRKLGAEDETYQISVAGPTSLLISKLVKFAERAEGPRLIRKDAHDIYRLLFAIELEIFTKTLSRITPIPEVASEAQVALECLRNLFAASPESLGARLAGETEGRVGEPALVSNRTWALSNELLESLES